MFKKYLRFIPILLLGQPHARPKYAFLSPIRKQWVNVLSIWKNKQYNDFGIERIIRLILALLQFAFPALYIRHLFSFGGFLGKKISVEAYVITKFLLPLIFFKFHLTDNVWVLSFTIYMMLDTITYLGSLIYLSKEFEAPISFKRSLTAIFINYIELGLGYAVIYSYYNANYVHFFNRKVAFGIQEIYFSFVTSAAVGYGDIYPVTSLGQLLVISQIIMFFVFVGLFFNFFASKVHYPTDFNSKQK